MDDDTKIGILRVDFNGQHENPHTINDNVPDFLKPYVGMFFNYNEHHIHYFVEGYRTSLDWAIPLNDDNFPVKKISNSNDIIEVFLGFNKLINLITEFQINQRMII